jgi:hypothetical protein
MGLSIRGTVGLWLVACPRAQSRALSSIAPAPRPVARSIRECRERPLDILLRDRLAMADELAYSFTRGRADWFVHGRVLQAVLAAWS